MFDDGLSVCVQAFRPVEWKKAARCARAWTGFEMKGGKIYEGIDFKRQADSGCG